MKQIINNSNAYDDFLDFNKIYTIHFLKNCLSQEKSYKNKFYNFQIFIIQIHY